MEYQRLQNKIQGEAYFVQAVQAKGEGHNEWAAELAEVSIYFYKKANLQTLEDCVPTNSEINGINMPSLITEGLVRERFGIE
jgi:hypothetical protein